MKFDPRSKRLLTTVAWMIVAWLSFSLPTPAQSPVAGQKRVLVLYSVRKDAPVPAITERAIQKILGEGLAGRLDYYGEYIDVVRFPDPQYQSALRDFISSRYDNQTIDLIITVASAALDFVERYGDELFPGTPVVFLGRGSGGIEDLRSRLNCTGVIERVDLRGTLDLALKLQPGARQVFVVSGASEFDRGIEDQLRQEARGFEGRLTFNYLSGLTLEDIQKSVANLPKSSIVYHLTFTQDGAGNKFSPQESLQKIASVANAPVYIWVDAYRDQAVIGGSLMDIDRMANQAAEMALRVLLGERPENIPIIKEDSNVIILNWPQLQRWGISEDLIPAQSIIRFRDPTLWEQYEKYILGAIALFIFQTLLITRLIDARRGERAARQVLDDRLRFETMVSDLSAGFTDLPGAEVDRKIQDWVQRMVEFLGVDQAAFLQFSDDGEIIHSTHGYVSTQSDITASLTTKTITREKAPWYVDQLRSGVVLNSSKWLQELPPDAVEEREYGRRLGIKSHLAIPISFGGLVICALAFTTVRFYRSWSADLIARLHLVGGIFAGALARKRADEALHESERQFRAIFDEMAVGAALVDFAGQPFESNRALQQMLGYDAEELRRMPLTQFTHPEDLGKDAGYYKRLSAGEIDHYGVDKRYLRKDGRLVWAHFTVSLVRDKSGQPRFAIGMAEDITERKQAEKELQGLTVRLLQLQDDERRRIARELHDVTAQNLGTITINLEGLLQNRFRASEVLRILAECRALGEQSLKELRTLSYLLHPPMLDHAGLVFALEWFIDGFIKRSGIYVGLVAPPDLGRLPSELEIALFRVVQECLINIHRHSGSSTAEIRLEKRDGRVVLEVKDQGRGLPANGGVADAEDIVSVGVGIPGMRQRLVQLGGSLEIETSDQGTTVTAVVPLEQGGVYASYSAGGRP